MAKTGWTENPATLLRVGAEFSLAAVDPASTPGFRGARKDGQAALADAGAELSDLQERLFAASVDGETRSVLLVLQGMDTSGKGGIVSHVFSGVQPQGLSVHAFKAPTRAELRHDFLWRVRRQLPAPGRIGVFDRSHYEDVIARRVKGLSPRHIIERRYGIITEFEAEVVASGTSVVKVMLHISPDEQKQRLRARLDDPDKHWKYSPGDLADRALWPAFQDAYQVAVERTSTPDAPWFVVPADHKWYARIAVQQLMLEAMRSLDLQWPAADFDVRAERKRLAKSSPQPKASTIGRNLSRVSTSSRSGTDSATIPAPA